MLSHFLDTFFEIGGKFFLCYSATTAIFVLETEYFQIVQLAKDAQLTEFGDSRDEDEAQVALLLFQGAEEVAHYVAYAVLQMFVVQRVVHWGIVFVDEHNSLPATFHSILMIC